MAVKIKNSVLLFLNGIANFKQMLTKKKRLRLHVNCQYKGGFTRGDKS